MKKILLTLALLLPLTTNAQFVRNWNGGSTINNQIFPNRVNGVEQTVVANNYIATSTTATSTFSGGISAQCITIFGGSACLPSNATSTNFWYANGTSIYNNNSGNVGIGTTSPDQILTVTGQSVPGFIHLNGSNNSNSLVGSLLESDNNGTFSVTAKTDVFFRTNNGNNTPLYLTSGNNVGIGTTTPQSRLSVVGGSGQGLTVTNAAYITNGIGSQGTLELNNGSLSSPVSSRIAFGTDGSGYQLRLGKDQAGTYTDYVTLQDNGNFGIGTTTPDYPLTLQSNSGNIMAFDRSNVRVGTITASSNNFQFLALNTMTFGSSGTGSQMVLKSGNLGLGTTSPINNLTVSGSSPKVDIDTTGTTDLPRYDFFQNDVLEAFTQYRATGAAVDPNSMVLATNSTGGQLIFKVDAATEAMRIINTGLVGIGTSTPAASLSVTGAGQSNTTFNTTSGLGGTLYLNDSGSNVNNGGAIMFGTADNRFAAIKGLLTNSANNSQGAINFLVRFLATDATLSSAMIIRSSGKVGVGTTTPGSQLTVGTGGVSIGADYSNNVGNNNLLVEGTVGIATSSPFRTFSVTGTMAVSGLTAFATGDSAVCQRAGGEITVDSGISSCIVSSRKVKHDILNVSASDSLTRIMALNPVSFEYNGSNKKDLGLIADDVAKIDQRYAQYAGQDEKQPDGQIIKKGDPSAINWSAITADLIKTVQAQQKEIDALTARLDKITK